MSELSKMTRNQFEFLLKGNNDSSIAKQFGVARQSVYKIRKKLGIKSAKNDFKKKKIIELKQKGVSVTKIIQSTGMSQSYIYRVLNGSGINFTV